MNSHIKKLIQVRWLQHMLFWMLSLYFIGSYFSISNTIKSIDIVYSLFFHISLVVLVYLNIRFLIPILLEKRRYFLYFLLSVGLVALTYGIHELTFEIAIPLLPIDYYIVSFVDYEVLITAFVIYLVLSSLIKLSKSWFKVQQLQQDKLEMELESLKFQVNPHFLLNSLNNIYGLALKKSDRTPEVVLKLSNILKHMLYDHSGDEISLLSEISFITDYIELQKLRSSQKAKIELDVSGDNNDLSIAPFLLINFIENGIKHGLGGNIESPYAYFQLRVVESKLHFEARNSVGQAIEYITSDGGLGLKNVKRRLELLYTNKYQLDIDSNDNEFVVKLDLDLK